MTAEQAIAKLKELQKSGDTEAAHCEADDVLCQMLIALGHQAVIDEYNEVSKWYA